MHGSSAPIMNAPPSAFNHAASRVFSDPLSTPSIERAVSWLSFIPMFFAMRAFHVTPAAPRLMVPWYQSSAAFTGA